MRNDSFQVRVGHNLRTNNIAAAPEICREPDPATALTTFGERSFPWLFALSLCSTVAGCTAADDVGSRVEQASQAIMSSAALFLDTTTSFGSDADWDPNHGKAVCAPGDAIVGLSEIPDGPGRTALCQASTAALSPGNVTATLLFSGTDQRLADRGGDWSQGFIKFECGIGQYLSAVSENAAALQGDNRFHGIQCALGTGLGDNETCTARVFDAGDDRGTTSTGDWDPGAFKGECGVGAYAVGVSASTTTGAPHAILCCSSSSTP